MTQRFFLHAFVLNIHGALDNLAHVWVKERNLTKTDGKHFSDNEIGLLRHNGSVRNSIREAEISEFSDFDKWLKYFQSYRRFTGSSDTSVYPSKAAR
jgi:hypothetical protein